MDHRHYPVSVGHLFEHEPSAVDAVLTPASIAQTTCMLVATDDVRSHARAVRIPIPSVGGPTHVSGEPEDRGVGGTLAAYVALVEVRHGPVHVAQRIARDVAHSPI